MGEEEAVTHQPPPSAPTLEARKTKNCQGAQTSPRNSLSHDPSPQFPPLSSIVSNSIKGDAHTQKSPHRAPTRAGALLFAEISERRGCVARRACAEYIGARVPPDFYNITTASGGASAPIDEAQVQELHNRASRISERFCAPALVGALGGLFRLHRFIALVSGNR